MGAEILFGKVLTIGLPGIFVAWIVTPLVLLSTYWLGQRIIKIPSKTLNITISADLSVCGVSAAIATASACRAKREELTLAIGLSLIFTSVMMIVMPAFIQWVGMDTVLGGAWLGGTLDATGAVAAAGAYLGEKALHVAATVKMIQNILIGLIALGVAIVFVPKDGTPTQSGEKPTVPGGTRIRPWNEIWNRFPKFVLGFIAASVVFSWLVENLPNGHQVIESGVIDHYSKHLRKWFFTVAFVSIGLSTNFRTLKSHLRGGKPLVLYVCGQAFNILLTLGMAYLMFGILFKDRLAGL
jgi:uncharacterized membrane protein YadS